MEPSSSKGTRGESSRGRGTRRSWSEREEEVLLRCMKEIVAEGWKSDNGFRTGYLNRLESMMAKTFPGTDLKAIPHINSKIHVWKKDYASLVSMVGKSGIGFCHGTNMIEATNEAWDSYIKVDTNARLMRFKAWPMFKDWIEVFGKDRATGEGAEDVHEAATKIAQDNDAAENAKIVPDDAPFTDETDTDGDNISVCKPHGNITDEKSLGKKRKNLDESKSVLEALGQFLNNAESRLSEIASRIGYEQDAKAARKELFKMLKKINGLTTAEKLKAADNMVKNTERLEFFQSLPDEDRYEYVIYLLTLNE